MNLNVKSLQTEEYYDSDGFGFNLGVGFNNQGNLANINRGFNINNSNMHRLWTDDITEIKGLNSVVINTGLARQSFSSGNMTSNGHIEQIAGEAVLNPGIKGDLNLTGAAILSDNMTLNIEGNINKKDLQDSYYSESVGFGIRIKWSDNIKSLASTK